MKNEAILLKIAALAALTVILLLSRPVLAVTAFCTMEGTSQGAMTQGAGAQVSVGSLYQEGHDDEIYVLGITQAVTTPLDPQSGQAIGRRVHQPISIIKPIDLATPRLYQALATGETLTQVEIRFFRPTSEPPEERYFTIMLQDAVIVEISSVSSTVEGAIQKEKVSLTYRSITWTHDAGGTSSTDDWEETP